MFACLPVYLLALNSVSFARTTFYVSLLVLFLRLFARSLCSFSLLVLFGLLIVCCASERMRCALYCVRMKERSLISLLHTLTPTIHVIIVVREFCIVPCISSYALCSLWPNTSLNQKRTITDYIYKMFATVYRGGTMLHGIQPVLGANALTIHKTINSHAKRIHNKTQTQTSLISVIHNALPLHTYNIVRSHVSVNGALPLRETKKKSIGTILFVKHISKPHRQCTRYVRQISMKQIKQPSFLLN